MADTTDFKDWARTNKYLADNELRDAILSESDMLPEVEFDIKLEAYSKVLDGKAKRFAGTG
jgi:hypothetical protein